MRFAIYARFSSDQQSDASIEDQIAICRKRVDDLGGAVAGVYSDYAISGSHEHNRPEFLQMIEDARAGRFYVVIAEAMDRLSRNQARIAMLYERLTHHDIRIETLSEGTVNELHVGLKGTMNALFLKDLADKTRRGQIGRVRKGFSGGGKSYGYDVVRATDEAGEPIRGMRRVNEYQSEVVCRVFREFIDGRSARTIAADLNRDGIPSPQGKEWNASTINGSRKRRNGILYNELYVGRMRFNRQTFRKNPDTGRREARANDESHWITVDVPELRIIDDATWEAAQAIKSRYANKRPELARRPKRLLSGLLICGECGGAMTVVRRERYGCSRRHENGGCDNANTIAVENLEERVIAGIKERLLAPELVRDYIQEFRKASKELQGRVRTRLVALRKELREVEERMGRIIDAIEEGLFQPAMKDRMAALESRKVEISAEMEALNEPTRVVELHPSAADRYAATVDQLRDMLASADPAARESRDFIRSVIERIIMNPGEKRGRYEIEIHGQLAVMLGAGPSNQAGARSTTTVVAGARNHRELTLKVAV